MPPPGTLFKSEHNPKQATADFGRLALDVCFGSLTSIWDIRSMSGYGVISEMPVVRFAG